MKILMVADTIMLALQREEAETLERALDSVELPTHRENELRRQIVRQIRICLAA